MESLAKDHLIKDRKYYVIVIFIYISVFINSYIFFKDPFEFYIGYLIYLVLLPAFIGRHRPPFKLIGIFIILFISGLFNISIGNNTPQLFFKVFTGILLSYLFYYYVIVEFRFNLEQLFKWYLKGSYIVSVIGIIQFISFQLDFELGYNYSWIFNKWGLIKGGNFGLRVNSVFGEPTYLAATLSASFFVSVLNFVRKEVYFLTRFQSMVIILVYFLSFSGLGQVGVFLSIILLGISLGFLRYIFVIAPLGALLFSFLYSSSKDFSERFDSTVEIFTTEKFVLGKTHGSSFILYNNFVVATENFKSNFMFGSGVGSHPVAFEKFSTAKNIRVAGFSNNSADANSMLLRLLSETGLFGTLLFLYVTFKCYVRRNEQYDDYHWILSNSILIMILLSLFRQGHYFLNGFPFFMIMYYYNYASYKSYIETGQDLYNTTSKRLELAD